MTNFLVGLFDILIFSVANVRIKNGTSHLTGEVSNYTQHHLTFSFSILLYHFVGLQQIVCVFFLAFITESVMKDILI